MERSQTAGFLKIERAQDTKRTCKKAWGRGKLFFCLLLFAFCFLLSTCGGVPETFYYTLAMEHNPPPDNDQAMLPFALGVEKFQSEVIYDDDRIIYRDSPFEIKYYYYRRWVAPPRHLVTEKVLNYLADSGLFEKVTTYPSIVNVKYVLSGRLLAFEEWDEQNHWYGKVGFKASLYDPATQRIIWTGKFEHLQPVDKKIPAAVVEAISLSLKQCLDDLARSLVHELGKQSAR
ncbi:MAG: ABC-type transport auxiliary lipoprotein family protein [candidate division KSB1 bacterium]|nr:ABC-type transport auxiliary lipoprotein family protein [candidate division KSB1 bacterium]MDZ7301401.1 ABC-type transport auxiliary lipoprotein family protein [candidate division KSB1 bacterium]